MKLVASESSIENSIIKYLTCSGWYCWKNLDQPLFANGSYRKLKYGQIKGISDLVAIKKSRVIFLEIKTLKGRLSKSQLIFGDKIISAGGEFYAISSILELKDIILSKN